MKALMVRTGFSGESALKANHVAAAAKELGYTAGLVPTQ